MILLWRGIKETQKPLKPSLIKGGSFLGALLFAMVFAHAISAWWHIYLKFHCRSTKFRVRFHFANFAIFTNSRNKIHIIMWGLLSSFRDKLNFENRTIIKEVTGIFVKKGFCQKRVLRYQTTNSNT